MLRTKGEPGKGGFWILEPGFDREPTPPPQSSGKVYQRPSPKKVPEKGNTYQAVEESGHLHDSRTFDVSDNSGLAQSNDNADISQFLTKDIKQSSHINFQPSFVSPVTTTSNTVVMTETMSKSENTTLNTQVDNNPNKEAVKIQVINVKYLIFMVRGV